MLLKFQQRISSLSSGDHVTLKLFHKIKLTWTSCRVSSNSWCQSSVFTVSNSLRIPIFLIFSRLLLNRCRSFLYLHKASGIWNWGDLSFCSESTKLKKVRVLNVPLASRCNTAKVARPKFFLRHFQVALKTYWFGFLSKYFMIE